MNAVKVPIRDDVRQRVSDEASRLADTVRDKTAQVMQQAREAVDRRQKEKRSARMRRLMQNYGWAPIAAGVILGVAVILVTRSR